MTEGKQELQWHDNTSGYFVLVNYVCMYENTIYYTFVHMY